MVVTLLLVAGAVLFALRDGALLAARPARARILAAVYAAVVGLGSTAVGALAERMSDTQWETALHSPALQAFVVAAHAALWLAHRRFTRSASSGAWIFAASPGPFLLICWLGLSREILREAAEVSGLFVGAAIGAVYLGLVACSTLLRPLSAPESALAHWAAPIAVVALSPASASPDSQAAALPAAPVIPLAAVLLLISASFVYHQRRAR